MKLKQDYDESSPENKEWRSIRLTVHKQIENVSIYFKYS